MPRKRQREAELVQSYENYVDDSVDAGVLAGQNDEELFVVDRAGSKNSRRKLNKEREALQSTRVVSKVERKLISKQLQDTSNKKKKKQSKELFDLWGDESSSAKPNKPSNKKKIRVPEGGLSYNPSHNDHQDVLAEAVALSIQHEEKLVRKNTAFDKVPQIANSVAWTESDESESESDDESDSGAEPGTRRTKPKEKLTRAQRNKIRNRNILQNERHKEREERDLMKDIEVLGRHVQSLEKEEKEREAHKEYIKALKEASAAEADGMTYDDAAAVPLSDELKGSLRAVKPKGIAVVDRTNAMRNTGDLMARDRRTRKKNEKPHAGKKIKWVAKYKY
mmetsp:Transcript_23040/g.33725  ORF Transcript_23040/g.33725 Transcript_23040/m.33725 type:complete len:336 (-) Transcript_23040:145-1152(-)